MCVCVCAETGRVKNCLGKWSLKVTSPDGECSNNYFSSQPCRGACVLMLLLLNVVYMYFQIPGDRVDGCKLSPSDSDGPGS